MIELPDWPAVTMLVYRCHDYDLPLTSFSSELDTLKGFGIQVRYYGDNKEVDIYDAAQLISIIQESNRVLNSRYLLVFENSIDETIFRLKYL